MIEKPWSRYPAIKPEFPAQIYRCQINSVSEINEFEPRLKSPKKPVSIEPRLKSWNIEYNFKWNQPYLSSGYFISQYALSVKHPYIAIRSISALKNKNLLNNNYIL